MEFKQGSLANEVSGGFVSVARASEVRAVVPGATFDEGVVIARYASNCSASDEKIRYRGMPGVRLPHKCVPRDEVLDEDRLKDIESREVFGERL